MSKPKETIYVRVSLNDMLLPMSKLEEFMTLFEDTEQVRSRWRSGGQGDLKWISAANVDGITLRPLTKKEEATLRLNALSDEAKD